MWDLKQNTLRLTSTRSVHTGSRFKERFEVFWMATMYKLVHQKDNLENRAMLDRQLMKTLSYRSDM